MVVTSAPVSIQEPLEGGIAEIAISIADLSFSYPDNPDVLKGICLRVLPGERVGLVGPNGAGKTTLFYLACGVLAPDCGSVTLFDKPVRPGRFHPDVGLIFQNADDQLFSPSVRDDVAFGPTNMGLSRAEIVERVTEALRVTGIAELADRPPHHLSGGEKRMVSIAGILAMRPRLMIYDEPTSNLDMRSRRRLVEFLQASPQAMLVASHDLEFILEVCERVVLLDEGHIVADGPAREILGDVALMAAHGLERPHSLVPHQIQHHHR
jgi:cobalt/nickel transport system ATP-binding protein